MRSIPLDTIIRIILTLFTGVAMLIVLLAAVLYGAKELFRMLLPRLDLEKELLQGNRAVALFCGWVFAATLASVAMMLIAVYNNVLR